MLCNLSVDLIHVIYKGKKRKEFEYRGLVERKYGSIWLTNAVRVRWVVAGHSWWVGRHSSLYKVHSHWVLTRAEVYLCWRFHRAMILCGGQEHRDVNWGLSGDGIGCTLWNHAALIIGVPYKSAWRGKLGIRGAPEWEQLANISEHVFQDEQQFYNHQAVLEVW